MENKPAKRSGGAAAAAIIVVVLVLVPLIYVLSIGPLVWLAGTGRISKSWMPILETAYSPLQWTANNVPVAGPAIESYAELWQPSQPAYAPPPAATYSPPAAPAGS